MVSALSIFNIGLSATGFAPDSVGQDNVIKRMLTWFRCLRLVTTRNAPAIVPTENSMLEKIGKVREPRRANHSGLRCMIASLGEASPSRARRIVPVFMVSTYIKEHIWRNGEGKKGGTLVDLGCFSFQASKNLNSGEGGALLTNNDNLAEHFEIFHNNGHLMTGPWQE